jgi:hypothetical protein
LCKCKAIIDIWPKSSTLMNFQEINLCRIHSHPTIFSTLWENMIQKTVWSSKISKTDSRMNFWWLWELCKGLWLKRVMFLKTSIFIKIYWLAINSNFYIKWKISGLNLVYYLIESLKNRKK